MNCTNLLFHTCLTLLGRGGNESARPFFRWLFLHEKRGLEVQNFVTFSNPLWTFRKSKKNFLVFHSVLSNIQEPRSIRVKFYVKLKKENSVYTFFFVLPEELSRYVWQRNRIGHNKLCDLVDPQAQDTQNIPEIKKYLTKLFNS